MAPSEEGLLARLSVFLGRFRAFFVPFGLFSILAIGIHSGSDHIDDVTYDCLNFIDSLLDDLLAAIIRPVWEFFGSGEMTTQTAIFWAVDLIDLEVKDQIARFIALVVEMLADIMLALPVFLYREREIDIRGILEKTMQDPTILRIVAP